MSMTTSEFVSTSADGIHRSGTPLVTASTFINDLGTNPAVTIELGPGCTPDIDALWGWLSEPAEFFGHPMPDVAALGSALTSFAEVLGGRHGAATIVVAEVGGVPQFVVSGRQISPVRRDAVALAVSDARGEVDMASCARWQQMAARTTSCAAADHIAARLRAQGYVDVVAVDDGRAGAALLGTLLLETAAGIVATGARLQLMAALTPARGPVPLAGVNRAWWLSPVFERHPVNAIGAIGFEVPR